MPKFSDTFTDEQRRAIIAAVVDQQGPRLNRKEAMRRAAAGTLPGYEGAFEMSYSYVCELVSEEQLRRAPNTLKDSRREPAEAIALMAARLLRIEERELARIEKAAGTKPRDEVRARGVARNLEAIGKVIGAKAATDNAGRDTGKGKPAGVAATDPTRTAWDRLTAAHQAAEGPSDETPHPTETHEDTERDTQAPQGEEEEGAQRDNEQAEQEAERATTRFPPRVREPSTDAATARPAGVQLVEMPAGEGAVSQSR